MIDTTWDDVTIFSIPKRNCRFSGISSIQDPGARIAKVYLSLHKGSSPRIQHENK